jgi:hypothetical protein
MIQSFQLGHEDGGRRAIGAGLMGHDGACPSITRILAWAKALW